VNRTADQRKAGKTRLPVGALGSLTMQDAIMLGNGSRWRLGFSGVCRQPYDTSRFISRTASVNPTMIARATML